MQDQLPEQGPRVQALLTAVTDDRQSLLKLGLGEGAFFPLDLMAFGALKRSISTASAMVMMVKAWNMVCARTLLRTHIDTSLRFSSAWLVEKPHDFATNILKGERIDRMKSRSGERLTDAYLVATRAPDYPWLPDVYANLSGYIHFSGSHITSAVARFGDNRTMEIEISETDLRFPEFSWIEVLECFREATAMLAHYLDGYRQTKSMTPEELAAGRRAG
ncbi:hypothetical protein ACLBKS_02800 [Hylemonella sp. W303a]|uniref:hypothetical protein n=1 Tax=Hylemonella sp. W303a TaxID=3389873 RepID=UPI00396B3223